MLADNLNETPKVNEAFASQGGLFNACANP